MTEVVKSSNSMHLDIEAVADLDGRSGKGIGSGKGKGDAPPPHHPAAAQPLPGTLYDLFPPRQKVTLMLVCALSFILVPISDTIYLPALTAIERDLGTTAEMAAASVALYMVAVAAGGLVFGPAADFAGRRPVMVGATLMFVGASVGCALAPGIRALLALRIIQGFFVSACATTSNAVIADVYEPAHRGRAQGIVSVPNLVGPVVGPLLGGGLSQALGWRSTFWALAIVGGASLALQLAMLRETHHWIVLKRLRRARGAAAVAHLVHGVPRPKFVAPYMPLIHLLDRKLVPHVATSILLFSAMFAAMVAIPPILAAPPYNMSESAVGAAQGVPFGIGGLIAAPIGGVVADACAARWPGALEARVAYATAAALTAFPFGMMLFSWALHNRLPAAVALVGGFFINAAMTSSLPATMSLITIRKQEHAGAAGGGMHVLQFAVAAAFVQVTPLGVERLGLGPFMTVVFACALLAAVLAALSIARAMRKAARRGDLYAPHDADPAHDGDDDGAAAASEETDPELMAEGDEEEAGVVHDGDDGAAAAPVAGQRAA